MSEPTRATAGRLSPYFEALDRGELLTTRCRRCSRMQFPPRAACSSCGSLESLDWEPASGRGHVWSFCTFHKQYGPGFPTPYVVAIIELEEGTRLASNVVGIDRGDITVGMPVRATFTTGESGGLVQFVPAAD